MPSAKRDDTYRDSTPLSLAEACACGMLAIAAAVATGAIFNIDTLRAFATFEFYPNTLMTSALGLMILGVAVIALKRHLDQMALVSAVTVGLLSVASFLEVVAKIPIDLNSLFAPATKGRASLVGAISFGLAALTLALSVRPALQSSRLFSALLLALLFLPLAALIGYISNAQTLSRVALFRDFSLPESLGFVLFWLGIVSTTDNHLLTAWHNTHSRKLLLTLTAVCVFASIGAAQLALIPAWGLTAATVLFCTTLITATLVLCTTQVGLPLQAQKPDPQASLPEHAYQGTLLDFLENIGEGLLLVDNTGTIRYTNSAITKIFGWPQTDLLHSNLQDLIPKRFRAAHLAHFQRFFQLPQNQEPQITRGELIGLTQQGFEKSLAISLFKMAESNLVVATVRELTGMDRELAGKIKTTHLDTVTGMPNREEFARFCDNHWQQIVRKSENTYCVQVIDLDGLKNINIKYGREFGNTLLQTVANTIKSRLRNNDKLFRYSSDEFVLICSDIDNAAAEILAERIRTSLKVTPTRLADNNIYVTCSIALTLCETLPTNLSRIVEQLSETLNSRDPEQKDQVISVATPH